MPRGNYHGSGGRGEYRFYDGNRGCYDDRSNYHHAPVNNLSPPFMSPQFSNNRMSPSGQYCNQYQDFQMNQGNFPSNQIQDFQMNQGNFPFNQFQDFQGGNFQMNQCQNFQGGNFPTNQFQDFQGGSFPNNQDFSMDEGDFYEGNFPLINQYGEYLFPTNQGNYGPHGNFPMQRNEFYNENFMNHGNFNGNPNCAGSRDDFSYRGNFAATKSWGQYASLSRRETYRYRASPPPSNKRGDRDGNTRGKEKKMRGHARAPQAAQQQREPRPAAASSGSSPPPQKISVLLVGGGRTISKEGEREGGTRRRKLSSECEPEVEQQNSSPKSAKTSTDSTTPPAVPSDDDASSCLKDTKNPDTESVVSPRNPSIQSPGNPDTESADSSRNRDIESDESPKKPDCEILKQNPQPKIHEYNHKYSAQRVEDSRTVELPAPRTDMYRPYKYRSRVSPREEILYKRRDEIDESEMFRRRKDLDHVGRFELITFLNRTALVNPSPPSQINHCQELLQARWTRPPEYRSRYAKAASPEMFYDDIEKRRHPPRKPQKSFENVPVVPSSSTTSTTQQVAEPVTRKRQLACDPAVSKKFRSQVNLEYDFLDDLPRNKMPKTKCKATSFFSKTNTWEICKSNNLNNQQSITKLVIKKLDPAASISEPSKSKFVPAKTTCTEKEAKNTQTIFSKKKQDITEPPSTSKFVPAKKPASPTSGKQKTLSGEGKNTQLNFSKKKQDIAEPPFTSKFVTAKTTCKEKEANNSTATSGKQKTLSGEGKNTHTNFSKKKQDIAEPPFTSKFVTAKTTCKEKEANNSTATSGKQKTLSGEGKNTPSNFSKKKQDIAEPPFTSKFVTAKKPASPTSGKQLSEESGKSEPIEKRKRQRKDNSVPQREESKESKDCAKKTKYTAKNKKDSPKDDKKKPNQTKQSVELEPLFTPDTIVYKKSSSKPNLLETPDTVLRNILRNLTEYGFDEDDDDDSSESIVTEPCQESIVTEPSQESIVAEPSQEFIVTKPCQKSIVTESYQESIVTEPSQESIVAEPCQESIVTEPCQESIVIEPSRESIVTEPCQEFIVTEPSQESIVAEPCQESIVTEPCQESIMTEPCQESIVTEPCQESIVAEPCQESIVTEPCKEAAMAEPQQEPAGIRRRRYSPDSTTETGNSSTQVIEFNLPDQSATCELGFPFLAGIGSIDEEIFPEVTTIKEEETDDIEYLGLFKSAKKAVVEATSVGTTDAIMDEETQDGALETTDNTIDAETQDGALETTDNTIDAVMDAETQDGVLVVEKSVGVINAEKQDGVLDTLDATTDSIFNAETQDGVSAVETSDVTTDAEKMDEGLANSVILPLCNENKSSKAAPTLSKIVEKIKGPIEVIDLSDDSNHTNLDSVGGVKSSVDSESVYGISDSSNESVSEIKVESSKGEEEESETSDDDSEEDDSSEEDEEVSSSLSCADKSNESELSVLPHQEVPRHEEMTAEPESPAQAAATPDKESSQTSDLQESLCQDTDVPLSEIEPTISHTQCIQDIIDCKQQLVTESATCQEPTTVEHAVSEQREITTEESQHETEVLPSVLAQTEVVPPVLAQTEVVPSVLAQTEVVPPILAQTEVVPSVLAQTEVLPSVLAQTEVLPSVLAQTEVVPSVLAQTEVVPLVLAQTEVVPLVLAQTEVVPSVLAHQEIQTKNELLTKHNDSVSNQEAEFQPTVPDPQEVEAKINLYQKRNAESNQMSVPTDPDPQEVETENVSIHSDNQGATIQDEMDADPSTANITEEVLSSAVLNLSMKEQRPAYEAISPALNLSHSEQQLPERRISPALNISHNERQPVEPTISPALNLSLNDRHPPSTLQSLLLQRPARKPALLSVVSNDQVSQQPSVDNPAQFVELKGWICSYEHAHKFLVDTECEDLKKQWSEMCVNSGAKICSILYQWTRFDNAFANLLSDFYKYSAASAKDRLVEKTFLDVVLMLKTITVKILEESDPANTRDIEMLQQLLHLLEECRVEEEKRARTVNVVPLGNLMAAQRPFDALQMLLQCVGRPRGQEAPPAPTPAPVPTPLPPPVPTPLPTWTLPPPGNLAAGPQTQMNVPQPSAWALPQPGNLTAGPQAQTNVPQPSAWDEGVNRFPNMRSEEYYTRMNALPQSAKPARKNSRSQSATAGAAKPQPQKRNYRRKTSEPPPAVAEQRMPPPPHQFHITPALAYHMQQHTNMPALIPQEQALQTYQQTRNYNPLLAHNLHNMFNTNPHYLAALHQKMFPQSALPEASQRNSRPPQQAPETQTSQSQRLSVLPQQEPAQSSQPERLSVPPQLIPSHSSHFVLPQLEPAQSSQPERLSVPPQLIPSHSSHFVLPQLAPAQTSQPERFSVPPQLTASMRAIQPESYSMLPQQAPETQTSQSQRLSVPPQLTPSHSSHFVPPQLAPAHTSQPERLSLPPQQAPATCTSHCMPPLQTPTTRPSQRHASHSIPQQQAPSTHTSRSGNTVYPDYVLHQQATLHQRPADAVQTQKSRNSAETSTVHSRSAREASSRRPEEIKASAVREAMSRQPGEEQAVNEAYHHYRRCQAIEHKLQKLRCERDTRDNIMNSQVQAKIPITAEQLTIGSMLNENIDILEREHRQHTLAIDQHFQRTASSAVPQEQTNHNRTTMGTIHQEQPNHHRTTMGTVHHEQPNHHRTTMGTVHHEQPNHHRTTMGTVHHEQPNHHRTTMGTVHHEQPNHHRTTMGTVHHEQPNHHRTTMGTVHHEQPNHHRTTIGTVHHEHPNHHRTTIGTVHHEQPNHHRTAEVHQEQPTQASETWQNLVNTSRQAEDRQINQEQSSTSATGVPIPDPSNRDSQRPEATTEVMCAEVVRRPCSVCEKLAEDTCSFCDNVWYCSTACQTADWHLGQHNFMCAARHQRDAAQNTSS